MLKTPGKQDVDYSLIKDIFVSQVKLINEKPAIKLYLQPTQ
ncbi:hypothetical protein CIT292_10675 [Citrobacter youngae ATCC 29220]|uniref:Uncharacterized protein n=1 Tax=Citrobacter youngae ATCC 29220 TaxID=500640 RepID=D4BK59_9ENTR|nr:hypothetical protein CIT292_10675 [Citrobacter youngae ATCC 29220]